MIRPASCVSELSDEDFYELIDPYVEDMEKYCNNNLVYELFAKSLSSAYNNSALFENFTLENEYNDAVDFATSMPEFENINVKKLKNILEKKYSLKIVNENPLKIEEIY